MDKRPVPDLLTPMLKPIETINTLITAFRTASAPLDIKAKDSVVQIQPENAEARVILILDGALNIYRTADNLRFVRAAAPNLFGMQGSPFRNNLYQFRSEKGAVLETLPYSRAVELVSEHQLFKEVLDFQTYLSDFQAYRTNLLISKSTYQIVCAFLFELEMMPPEQRLRTSVFNYIHEHTHLARSGVMKILSDLRQGEYINIENGKLVAILKKLPREY
ncbi:MULTISPECIES: helix-turn-helix domain-containing protein [Rahnella]|uniref:Helix-turn-helix domain-containing protein n=1 Tax=Rahnella laticis TaxID=2787622 RepID=A0ABS0E6U3_9GAMM|nr:MULTISPECIES: helix-turn-helix domain-containing protein [Rahnella]MBF7980727.1 helix-turn-helix domain-containing protein [Rahnella laticis]MBF8000818.1 helix-turn-helix domain-containing protein [Rahnella sp. LAC-M12]